MRHIQKIKDKHTKTLLSKKNVIGVMTAHKLVDGVVGDLGITCLVNKKVPLIGLQYKDIIPTTLCGIETDVIEVGNVIALSDIDRTSRLRPAPMGTSGGHIDITAGTNGELLVDNNSGLICIGTNNHVGANSNNANIGDPYLQPGIADGGDERYDVIGSLWRFVPIKFTGEVSTCPVGKVFTGVFNIFAKLFKRKTRLNAIVAENDNNLVDAAMILINNVRYVDARILEIGIPKGQGSVTIGMQVQKSGRTTGLTTGNVISIDATITVGYGEGRNATFTNQIIIGTPGFSAGGDSGSLVLDMGGYAVGKLFAGSDQITIANSIDDYLRELDARLLL